MIIKFLLVGLGGFTGAILRYSMSQWINKNTTSLIPLATLVVNLSGSFFLGVLIGLDVTTFWFILIGTGVLGAFTTFSTFKLESIQLHLEEKWKAFTVYTLLSYMGGISLAYTGFKLGQWLVL